MQPQVYVFDPTASDQQSKVRGIGRYLQILKENFENEFVFISDLGSVTTDPYGIFINPFFNFLQPPPVMKRIAKKQIAVIHDLIPLKYPEHFPIGIKGKINVFLNKLALNNYDEIITDSEASKKDIIDILGLNENKIHVIYPCLPNVFLNPKQNVTSYPYRVNKLQVTTPFCLYVGDATWNKNLVTLARAIKLANINCIFVGKVFEKSSSLPFEALAKNGWQKEFNEFLKATKNDNKFIFVGFVPDSELINLYTQAACNILPSRDEGFGFSYLEAAAQSCPSILSDISILREISDNNALFFPAENPQELANLIKKIISDNKLTKELGKKAFERSLFFSQQTFKKEFIKLCV
ncbi:MAG: glycosyltransferase family 1 protein [bacterium]|nr:glycosyltransferase family 1 protein [bacterium]